MCDSLNVLSSPEVVRILEVEKNVAHRLREWKKMLKEQYREAFIFLACSCLGLHICSGQVVKAN
jgi:hypothetical protein